MGVQEFGVDVGCCDDGIGVVFVGWLVVQLLSDFVGQVVVVCYGCEQVVQCQYVEFVCVVGGQGFVVGVQFFFVGDGFGVGGVFDLVEVVGQDVVLWC